MKTRMFLLRGAMMILLAGSAAVSLGAGTTYTWNYPNLGTGNWTNSASWSPSTGFPTNSDTAVFTNTALGTCTVSSNVTVGTLWVNASNNAAFTIAINPSYTLIAKAYYQGYMASSIPYNTVTNQMSQVTVYGGGTFATSGQVWIAAAPGNVALNTTNVCSLTLSNVTWDTSGLNGLNIATGYKGECMTGTVNAAKANAVMYYGVTNTLGSINDILVGYENQGGTAANNGTGFLYLPATVTNIFSAQSVTVGGYESIGSPGYSIIDSGPLSVITATNGVILEAGIFTYNNGSQTGFPANITLNIGSPTHYGSLALHEVYSSSAPMPLSYTNGISAFNCWLNWLYVGASEGGGANNQNVVVDLSEHAVTNWNWSGSLTKTSLSVTNISIGSAIASGTSGSGKGGGTLFLPSSLTNIWCSQFALGYQSGAYYLTNTVNLGTNSGAIAFTVASNLKIGMGSFLTLSGPGGSITNTAFPMGSTLTVGSPSAPATVCQIGKGYSNSMVFGRGFTNVAIYCANHTVGGGLSSAVKNNVNNDFRDAVNLTIVATNALQLGINSGDIASMYVPANSFIACSNVVIGANSSSTYSWYLAALYMSNTAIAVSNSITLNPTAIVTNYINGISSGFDIGTTNFTVAGTNFGGVATQYGRINLVFVSDPINPTKPYWGLRLKGDARSWLPNLTNAPTATTLANNGYLSWSTAGLSASARSRFGIQYDGVYTYVGVSPTSGGMTMFFW